MHTPKIEKQDDYCYQHALFGVFNLPVDGVEDMHGVKKHHTQDGQHAQPVQVVQAGTRGPAVRFWRFNFVLHSKPPAEFAEKRLRFELSGRGKRLSKGGSRGRQAVLPVKIQKCSEDSRPSLSEQTVNQNYWISGNQDWHLRKRVSIVEP